MEEKKKMGLYFINVNTNSRWIKHLNMEVQNLNTLEENVQYLYKFKIGKDFL